VVPPSLELVSPQVSLLVSLLAYGQRASQQVY